MVHVSAVVKRWGNSLGLIIPRDVAQKLKLDEGKKVDVDIVPKQRINAFGISRGAKPFERELEEREF